jgi:membrane-associated phospholipid phosphatase
MPEDNVRGDFIHINLTRNMYLFIVITSLILWILAVTLWIQGDIDRNIIIAHNTLYGDNVISGIFQFFSKYGMALITAVYILNLLLSYKIKVLKSSYPLYILILLSFGIGGIAGDLLKEVFEKARPAVELAGQITRTHVSASPAFPSGHATKSMALALPYFLLMSGSYYLNRIFKLTVFSIAILVCYARIVLQAHYVSDVLAGIGTAIAFVPIAALLSNKIYELNRVDEKKLKRMVIKLGIVLSLLTVYLTFK